MADASTPLASRLSYAQCWEDVRLLLEALEPGPGKRLLSIASAGDNSIALALAGARVTALDLSEPQLACVELKLAGRHLDHAAFLRLLGVTGGEDRLALYEGLRPHLPDRARGFFDAHHGLLEAGLVGSGRFERYLARFRTRVLPLVHRPRTTREWFDLEELYDQRRFYEDRWDGWRWRGLFRLFFSRRVMAALGRSPEQFAHVDGEVGDALLGRARWVLTELPLRDNGYVQWMLTGGWVHDEAVPAYLTPEGHARLGEAAERITLVHASLQEHLEEVGEQVYDGFNLSDLFEYLSEEQTDALMEQLARAGRPGARLAYWNLFVPRHRPERLADRLVPLEDLAAGLSRRDRAFVYGGFRVEEVR